MVMYGRVEIIVLAQIVLWSSSQINKEKRSTKRAKQIVYSQNPLFSYRRPFNVLSRRVDADVFGLTRRLPAH